MQSRLQSDSSCPKRQGGRVGGKLRSGARAGSRSARLQPGAEGPRLTRWRVPCDRSGERMCSPGLLLELETDRLGASWCAVTVCVLNH